MKGLANQNILVTGASRGIGRAIAEKLISEKATVALHYRSGLEQVEDIMKVNPDGNAFALQADLNDTQATIQLFDRTIEQLGSIESVVINAGVFVPHPVEMPLEAWLEIWYRTIKVNLESAAVLTKLFIDHFKQQQGGRLIYIGSRAAFRGETEEYLAYAASKGGLTSLAKSVARSFGKYNIKSFVIAPGFVKTEMAMDAIASIGEEKVMQNLALNQLTQPQDIAPVVALLCSGQMDHATGTTIDMNAGSHIR